MVGPKRSRAGVVVGPANRVVASSHWSLDCSAPAGVKLMCSPKRKRATLGSDPPGIRLPTVRRWTLCGSWQRPRALPGPVLLRWFLASLGVPLNTHAPSLPPHRTPESCLRKSRWARCQRCWHGGRRASCQAIDGLRSRPVRRGQIVRRTWQNLVLKKGST